MRVHLGSDHAGFELKAHLVAELAKAGHDVVDVGAPTYEAEDDYPAYCIVTAAKVVADAGSLGVVIGGSGNGEQIAANKVPGVRAALAWDPWIAEGARRWNDANVLVMSLKRTTPETAREIVGAWLSVAEPDEDERANFEKLA